MNIFIFKEKQIIFYLYFIILFIFYYSIIRYLRNLFIYQGFACGCVCVCVKYVYYIYISHIRITNNTTANNGIDEIKTGQR